jgi:two-component system repressor protein LuxO
VRNVVVLHDEELVSRPMLPAPVLRPGSAAIAVEAPVAAPEAAWEAPMGPEILPMRPPEAQIGVEPLAVAERRLIEAAIRHTGGDVPRAATLLEINPSTVYRKLALWRAEAKVG